MKYDFIIYFLLSLGITLLIGNPLIRFLQTLNMKQTIRVDGPKEHIKKKSNIPTIGGLIFLIPLIIFSCFALLTQKTFLNLDFIVVVCSTITMGGLGFIDDYLKVTKKHNKGISGWTKLLIQLITSIIIVSLYYREGNWFVYLIWVFFIIAGATNSYNLTDGLDGLLASVSLASFIGLLILSEWIGKAELSYFVIVFMGALCGFLYFNKNPAKIFMGDTGSLAIGGAVGSIAIVCRSEIYLVFFATIPIVEALSVILQVISSQATRKFIGKDIRIFKMAPYHHHLELIGFSEKNIVRLFFIVQFLFVIVGTVVLWLNQAQA